jgi:hypothetical protein
MFISKIVFFVKNDFLEGGEALTNNGCQYIVFCSSTTPNPSLYQGKPIEQWNQNDIFQWFQYNQILPELRDLCWFKDGYELMNFAKMFLENEQLQYQRFSNEFLRPDGITRGQKALPLHEFTKFSNALRTLGWFRKTT